MKVIRQIQYEGSEEAIRKQLALSMPEGKRDGWGRSVTIEVRTVYSELPKLDPFVPLSEEETALLQGEEAKKFLSDLLEEIE